MPKNTKRSGSNFERRVSHFLENKGWFVIRSSGSRSCADLLAIDREGKTLAIQCKATEKPGLALSERTGLLRLRDERSIRVLVICRHKNNSLLYYQFVCNELKPVKEPTWLTLENIPSTLQP